MTKDTQTTNWILTKTKCLTRLHKKTLLDKILVNFKTLVNHDYFLTVHHPHVLFSCYNAALDALEVTISLHFTSPVLWSTLSPARSVLSSARVMDANCLQISSILIMSISSLSITAML